MLEPQMGIITFRVEGNNDPSSALFSRRAHAPPWGSGVTIGRGYDMKKRDASAVKSTLLRVGVPPDHARLLSGGVGLVGQASKLFVQKEEINQIVITELAQVKLFKVVYTEKYNYAKKMCMKKGVQDKYGKCDWNSFPKELVELIVDLTYRGDYTGGDINTRRYLQPPIVNKDWEALKKALWMIPGAKKIYSRTKKRIELVDIIIRKENLKSWDPIAKSQQKRQSFYWWESGFIFSQSP